MEVSLFQRNLFIEDKLNKASNTKFNKLNLVYLFKIQNTAGEIFSFTKFKKACQNSLGQFASLSSYFNETNKGLEKFLIESFTSKIESNIFLQDISYLGQEEKVKILEQWKTDLYLKRFDLFKFPLWNIRVIKIDNETHYIGFIFHHIIVDAIALKKIFQSLSSVYNNHNFLNSKIINYPKLYTNHLIQEKEYSLKQEKDTLNYYKNYLLKNNLTYRLPWNNADSDKAYKVHRKLDQNFISLIQNLSSTLNQTKFCTLMSIFGCFFSKFISREQIFFGCPIGKRLYNLKDLDFFQVNTLPISINIDKSKSFKDLLEHFDQALKFNVTNKLIDIQKLKHSLSINKLQSIYDLVSSSTYFGKLQLGQLSSQRVDIEIVPATCDLVFYVDVTSQNWEIAIEYRTDFFSKDVAISILYSFIYFAQQIASQPNIPIKDLKLGTAKVLGSSTPINKPIKTVSELIESNKHGVAIQDNERKISYSELHELTRKGAGYLQHIGVKKGCRIMLLLDKSIETIIAILAILKAGAAYVPLDPDLPLKRIKNIIGQVKPDLLIANKNTINLNVKNIIYIHDLWEIIQKDNLKFTFINPLLEQENEAYIIFTSGSTGQPKGVIINHRGLCNLIEAQGKILNLRPNLNVLAFASLSFDASISEIFTTLSFGSSLCIPQGSQSELVSAIPELINKFKIHIVTLPPSVINILKHSDIYCLRYLLLAGEQMSSEIPKIWADKVKLFNAYGPTENTVCTSMNIISTDSLPNNIGYPIQGVEAFIEIDNQIAPSGSVGEICVAGKSLCSGYIDNDSINQQKFSTSIINNTTKKYYRTGDIGYIANDNIMFLGRKDRQVKIKGFRIELDEIETLLQRDKRLKKVICVVEEDSLLAFHTSNCEEIILKNWAKSFLPHYMVPKAFIKLDHFPINKRGKIDTEALVDIYQSLKNKNASSSSESKWDKVSSQIKKIWEEILESEVKSLDDNFFDLGGESLRVARLVIVLKKTFRLNMDIESFFDNPTIRYCKSLIMDNNFNKQSFNPWDEDLNLSIPTLSFNETTTNLTHKTILLTGVTGFVGAYILNELFKRSDITKVYCLTRRSDSTNPFDRIRENFQKYELDTSKLLFVEVLEADLSLPNLGLTNEQINLLKKDVTDVIHAAAHVHHLYDYSYLKSTNVWSTLFLLDICQGSSKKFHYISAISAINDFDNENITENWPISYNCKLSGGYNQTKWVCEMLLKKALDNGYNICIYRLPTIWGARDNPIFNWKKDHQACLIKGCVELGYAPEIEANLLVAPVDEIALHICQVALDKRIPNKVYNILPIKPYSWHSTLQLIIDYYDLSIEIVSFNEWQSKLIDLSEHNALYPLSSLYLSYKEYNYKFKINAASAANFLGIQNISFRNLNEKYLIKNLDQFLINQNNKNYGQ